MPFNDSAMDHDIARQTRKTTRKENEEEKAMLTLPWLSRCWRVSRISVFARPAYFHNHVINGAHARLGR